MQSSVNISFKSSRNRQEFALISVDFVPLRTREAATTLYRTDELAYIGACQRSHTLWLGKMKEPPGYSMGAEVVTMIRHGAAMKLTVRVSSLMD